MLDTSQFAQHLTGLIEKSINPVSFSDELSLNRSRTARNFIVAFSGGLDSHVLLHLMHQCQFNVRAVYIDHGLQDVSSLWGEHNRAVCEELGIDFKVIKVDAAALKGESPEASARGARYQALAAEMTEGDILLTAQHQNDQSETLLLQMLRTAGPDGLSAMPAVKKFASGWHIRPLLRVSQQSLIQYAEQNLLNFITDPSNEDQRFDRNFLRHAVFPLLENRWPSIHATFANVCELQAEVSGLMSELATLDADGVMQQNRLFIEKLTLLTPARQRNLVRYWLQQNGRDIPTMKRLEEILGSMITAAEDKMPVVSWQQTEVQRYKGWLYALPVQKIIDNTLIYPIDNRQCPKIPNLQTEVYFEPCDSGLSEAVFSANLSLRFRRGGESIKPIGRKHTMDLKKLMQEAGIPPWERGRLPLLYLDDSLIAVADFWIAEQYKNQPGEPAWQLKTRLI